MKILHLMLILNYFPFISNHTFNCLYLFQVLFNDDFTFDADVRLYVEYENPYEPECLVEKGDPEKSE